MCGIVGYVGTKNSIPILINGLSKLEYRGYDSAGIATIQGDGFEVHRVEGKLSNLRDLLTREGKLNEEQPSSGKIHVAIGHTRWATHGRPSVTNAHPHVAGKVCVVHNGIVENYLQLKKRLVAQGRQFASETDTEIAAHLVDSMLESSPTLFDAVVKATEQIEGSFSLVVITAAQPDRIVVAKNATPVIIGLGNGENFVASDIPAVLEHTRQIIVLEDGDIAEITADKVRIVSNGEEVKREPITVTWDPVTAQKGGYRHFMLKEIYDQPTVITDTFRGRIDPNTGDIFFSDLGMSPEELKDIKRVHIVACGTALHAALITKFYIERFARIPVEVDYGSEFRYREPVLDASTLFLVVSQSGETADTLGSLRAAKDRGVKTLAICNVVGSSISRLADHVLYTHAGPEISVASTKAFSTQLTSGLLFALGLGYIRGILPKEKVSQHMQELLHLPSLMSHILTFDKQIEKIAKKYGKSENFLFLGRGLLYPVALEGALKMKEISYIHAEGYPAGEMKHGPIALVNEETPVVVILGRDGVNYDKAMSNLVEVEARGARIIAVTDEDTPEIREVAWEVIPAGKMAPELLPIVLTIPLQLLAYHVACYRGTDVDQPRNLAKSVTVE